MTREMFWIGLGFVAIWAVVYPLTDYYIRWFDHNVVRCGCSDRNKICLTFDDGPDPLYTTRLLNILKELKIPAVFFLVGTKVENHPDLVWQIIAGGHEIGMHTFDHRHAYLMFWRKSIQTVERGYRTIRETTGQPPVWFRPPWGATNLFQAICAKKLQMRLVLWTANAADWKTQTGVTGIRRRLQKKVKGGTVIVLHDSGGEPGAPENTLRVLPEVISILQQRGLCFTTLADLLGGNHHERCNHIAKDRTSY